MVRGRPVKSQIRQNIIELLSSMSNAYGYQIFKKYNQVFSPVHMRSIYYHLRKGLETGEFVTHKISKESGDYSWGDSVEKTYYSLGPQAVVKGDERVKKV